MIIKSLFFWKKHNNFFIFFMCIFTLLNIFNNFWFKNLFHIVLLTFYWSWCIIRIRYRNIIYRQFILLCIYRQFITWCNYWVFILSWKWRFNRLVIWYSNIKNILKKFLFFYWYIISCSIIYPISIGVW